MTAVPPAPARTPPRRPSRWSPANWPVRAKVLAIALVPLLLAGVLAALRIADDFGADGAQRSDAVRNTVLLVAAFVVVLVIVAVVAGSLVGPLRRLRDGALRVAHEDLAREVEQVRAGAEPGPVTPLPVHTTEEIGQIAHAVDELHEQAVQLAGEQSRLQLQIGDMFETLSRRSRSLIDQQLSLIDELERNEDDPERLRGLFRLDHLAARMRRNGANLLVLSGARNPRERAEAMPVTAIVNAAASEVEDYTRVEIANVPDSRVAGGAAGDLIHLLAELLDNALRHSPPVAPVRVSAVHTGNGGLVVEVSDTGLGMAEADLRVANGRLQSGGEVTPHTARHMGLFVVGRLAARHGFVVRLRSTVADEANSGMTAGVLVPAELLVHTDRPVPQDTAPGDDSPATDPVLAVSREPAPHEVPDADAAVGGLPQRAPGASGISAAPPAAASTPEAAPSNTSAFFAAREQAQSNGVPAREETAAAPASSTAGSDDAIYQSMLSEWLVDPTELGNSSDLDWKSVWDHGWSAAAAAEEAPVREVTDEGLPVREPGARLVPGSGQRNGGAHRSDDPQDAVASAADSDTGADPAPRRDPQAVRASMSSHFGGVHAGRAHARETRGTDRE